MVNNFIFGYGSLICSSSRAKTGESGQAIPVSVKGLERQWNLPFESEIAGRLIIAVGVIANSESTCNGVITPVPESELPKFDKREESYTRIKLDPKDVSAFLPDDVIPQGDIWVYLVDDPQKPSNEAQLMQSYIDVILMGCLDISEQFAREFITTTTGWEGLWLNDRKTPGYPRAMKEVPRLQEIDNLLKELVSEAFNRRVSV
jgi:hypothetical protein